ncbi:dihydroorotate dehydrogenase [Desulfosporosinus sp.]|uniref:dihydroorotate dehydrogenase n=1 Tax=Desulfosporosinus sp. TaxID=157907 RepID=UPI000E815A5E|nr:dihydroorotate dehydrogenase [Desulfosporosinus sp.]MBC2721701.1 dihydroorotate dehydrogenase [Desulfosporosinus sp.]MBC2728138.1 dihydroorotate dehydrogenase [Desulfosporosinus sp.]HBV85904.1 dihydroorotate dehydrogenase [Desulfosporosinus sp.]
MSPVDFTTQLAGITLRNPLLTCSGTYGFGEEYTAYCPLESLGGITLKGITPLPRLGNPVPRLAETPAGLLNAVGLENPGLDEFVKSYLPKVRMLPTAAIANISGFSLEDYVQLARALQKDSGLAALEVNISCPNVKHGGMHFGTDPQSAQEVIAAVKAETDLPVIAKLSPNVTDIVGMARAVQLGGADALSLINTLLGMQIDIHRQRPVLANTFGGLSGPAIKPVAVRMVWQVFQAVDLPIIGMGGITTWQDAVEFLLAGATVVSIGTGNFVNPQAPLEILKGINDYCAQRGFASVRDLVGLAHN